MSNDYLPIEALRARYMMVSKKRDSMEMAHAAADLIGRICARRPEDILSQSRQKHLIVPRNLLYWALYEALGFTMAQIGQLTERDHSTVSHGISEIRKLEADPIWAEFILQAKRRIKHDLEAM